MRPLIGINCDFESTEKGPRSKLEQRYVAAVTEAGGTPVLFPPVPEPDPQILGHIDALILSGGDDIHPQRWGEEDVHEKARLLDPEKESFDIWLAREALKREIPTLGICLGMQILCVAHGGSIHQHLPDVIPAAEVHKKATVPVHINPGSRLESIIEQKTLSVACGHHQAVSDPGPRFLITATSEEGVIEGVESKEDDFCLAVQWHPEREPRTPALFRALVEVAARNAGKPV